jgi:hypothetical protein
MTGVPGGLGLALLGGQVLLGPRGVLLLAMSLRAAERVGRHDGVSPTADFVALRTLVERAAAEAASAVGRADLLDKTGMSRSSEPLRVGLVEPISTAEAATLLGMSARAVRERCRRGAFTSAVLMGRAWRLESAEVTAAALGRAGEPE